MSRSWNIVSNCRNAGRKLLEHRNAKAFDVTWKKSDRASGDQLRKFARFITGQPTNRFARRKIEIAEDGLLVGHRTEECEPRVRHRIQNGMDDLRPIARAFADAPHSEKA